MCYALCQRFEISIGLRLYLFSHQSRVYSLLFVTCSLAMQRPFISIQFPNMLSQEGQIRILGVFIHSIHFYSLRHGSISFASLALKDCSPYNDAKKRTCEVDAQKLKQQLFLCFILKEARKVNRLIQKPKSTTRFFVNFFFLEEIFSSVSVVFRFLIFESNFQKMV